MELDSLQHEWKETYQKAKEPWMKIKKVENLEVTPNPNFVDNMVNEEGHDVKDQNDVKDHQPDKVVACFDVEFD